MCINKVVFITGGGAGLGRVLLDSFYNAGYKIAFTYRKQREEIERIVNTSEGLS